MDVGVFWCVQEGKMRKQISHQCRSRWQDGDESALRGGEAFHRESSRQPPLFATSDHGEQRQQV